MFYWILGPVKQCFTEVIKAHCVHPEAYSTPTDTNDPFVSTKLIKGKETDDKKKSKVILHKPKSLAQIQIHKDRHIEKKSVVRMPTTDSDSTENIRSKIFAV